MSRVGRYRNRRPLRSRFTSEAEGRRSGSTAPTTAIIPAHRVGDSKGTELPLQLLVFSLTILLVRRGHSSLHPKSRAETPGSHISLARTSAHRYRVGCLLRIDLERRHSFTLGGYLRRG